ncbi:SCO family protein [Candidatus Viridilinea mediisalina]|uniref:SCO family protein n=1 Tax=Candidatus Viridilinea mediisalina TaxID=2024553 RepID=A0A2A6RIS9_9CHLR|nr:SCO family protein [Candidatus Viridilinea mediisalina]PDW02750.1 SCO family protein [Candidatus Viridilinea mediisalina]
MLRFIILTILLVVGLSACSGPPELKGTVIDPPLPAPDFTLTDHNGQPFTLSEQKGNIVMLYFGFTLCPDICPIELANLAAVKRELGAAAETMQVALITVDPERDLPERLELYVQTFDPDFIGLHGDTETLEPIYRDYGVFVQRRELPESAMEYTIDHSGFVYLIDKAGRWRMLYAHNTPTADIVSDLRVLLRE